MSFQASCSEESSSVPSSGTLQWPDLELQGESFKTEFTEECKWRCPICESEVKQIKNHLKKHQDQGHVQDWKRVETYCQQVAVLKRKETDRKRDSNPERKEAKRQTMKKVDAKRAGKPERIEAQGKLMKKKDAKRAGKPERKEVQKKAKKIYLLTPKGFLAKMQENQRYREKLGPWEGQSAKLSIVNTLKPKWTKLGEVMPSCEE